MGFHAPKVLPHTCIYGQTPPTLLRRRSVYCLVYAFFESGSFSEQMTIAKRYVNSNVCIRFPDYNANIAINLMYFLKCEINLIVYKQSCCSRLRLEQQLMNEILFDIKLRTLSLLFVLC